jgi:hypothetical protein
VPTQSRSARIRRLVERLTAFPESATLVNPYASHNPDLDIRGGAAIRRRNLEQYLSYFVKTAPCAILVGEAAGYQGCRFSGIAFTSEHTLTTHPFFTGGEFERSSSRERLFREPSGSIVWETIAELPTLPILWNVVPFHPHKPHKPLSNRMPLRGEQAAGFPFLLELRSIFDNPPLIAVGRIAGKSLAEAGLEHTTVRHPSHGGKAEFQRGLRACSW